MSTNNGFTGVSNCYVFKSRLQEYAQKAGISTPVYETVKEGPSHEPCFKSTVIVNSVRYDSLPGFFNRKAAEQSAAEIALTELAKSGNMSECLSSPVHETGLCKNLLQEYAQKMNYAIPSYTCHKDESPGKMMFSCTVEIGGIQYIGAAAKTKKEAEIKAARTALLAIQSNPGRVEGKPDSTTSQLTVLPCKKRGPEVDTSKDDSVKPPKPKKARFKKKWTMKRFPRNKNDGTKLDQPEPTIGNAEFEFGIQLDGTKDEKGFLREMDDGTKLDHSEPGSEITEFEPLDDTRILKVDKASQEVQNVMSELDPNGAPGTVSTDSVFFSENENQNFQEVLFRESNYSQNEQENYIAENAHELLIENSVTLVADMNGKQERPPIDSNFNQNELESSNMGILCRAQIKDIGTLFKEVNRVSGVGQMISMVTTSSTDAPEAPVPVVEEHKQRTEGQVQEFEPLIPDPGNHAS